MDILISVDAKLVTALNGEAKKSGRSRAAVIRSTLRRGLAVCCDCGAGKASGAFCAACTGCARCGGAVCNGGGCS